MTNSFCVGVEEINASDPLSETLGRLYVPNWISGEVVTEAGASIDIPAGLVSLYAVQTGDWDLFVDDAETPRRLEPGDFVLVAHGQRHRLSECRGGLADERSRGAWAEGRPARLVHGHFATGSVGRNPFEACMPPLVRLHRNASPLLRSATPLLDLVADESRAVRDGWQAVVDQLARLLFLQMVRAYFIQGDSAGGNGDSTAAEWLRASTDPDIGPILRLIANEPDKPWTVRSLAKRSNMSRSAFSERFRQVVGQPPLRYVTEHRMCKACELLRDTELGVKQIASLVGYGSVSSFSNAFKRWNGAAPAAFRKSNHEPLRPALL